jgi:pimeloyl-ACP methyl ester carboxylesterase
MPFLELDDARLFFTDDGAGEPPLLLVHGYTADSHDWSWQIPHFVAGHRVVAVDLRGHGASSSPVDGYTTAGFTGDLVALLDHLGVDRVVAVGHSLGGILVSALAVEHPERVAAVVAVDPAYLVEDDMVGALGPVLDSLDDAGVVPFIEGIIGEGMASPARDPGLRTWQVRRIATLEPRVLRQALVAQVSGMALRSESEPYLRRRRCPVLSFHADPVRGALEAALLTDQRSHVVTWEGAGHWLHQERAAEFNALVSAWLATGP